VIGFFFMLLLVGWHPDADHKKRTQVPASEQHASIGSVSTGPDAMQLHHAIKSRD
jgi:hypothetical protein